MRYSVDHIEINPLLHQVRDWLEKYKPLGMECVMQDDTIQIEGLPELAERVLSCCDISYDFDDE